MPSLKQRIGSLEKRTHADDELNATFGLDYFYGDSSKIRLMTRKDFRQWANRGLAAFYEEIGDYRIADPKILAY